MEDHGKHIEKPITYNMKIQNYISKISNTNLRAACEKLFEYPDFFSHPASTGIHHGYHGGLEIHTVEVLNYALQIAESFPNINKDILITAGLWHDLGKIWDYELAVFFSSEYSDIPKSHVPHSDGDHHKIVYIANKDYKNKIHHITGSTAEFTAAAVAVNVDRKLIQETQHCIISHHGRKDWGSIKEPQTLEAALLHQADYFSAHFGPRKDR